MLFAVFIILFGVSSTALTTFGKSNSQNVATPPPSNDQIEGDWQLIGEYFLELSLQSL